MFLIDTSVWINIFRDRTRQGLKSLSNKSSPLKRTEELAIISLLQRTSAFNYFKGNGHGCQLRRTDTPRITIKFYRNPPRSLIQIVQ